MSAFDRWQWIMDECFGILPISAMVCYQGRVIFVAHRADDAVLLCAANAA